MNLLVAAANEIEQVVTGNLPDQSPPLGTPTQRFPSIDITCTDFPDVIDDIYICAKDRVYPADLQDRVIATAGPYEFRPTNTDLLGLPFVAGLSVNVNFVNRDDIDLQSTFRHELFHTLGL